jgi:hypothetical protein
VFCPHKGKLAHWWHTSDDASGETSEEDDDEVFQQAPTIDDDEFYIPALHGEYSGLAGVTSDGTAVLDFSMLPVSLFARAPEPKLGRLNASHTIGIC